MSSNKETTECMQHTAVVKEKCQTYYRQSIKHRQDSFKKERLPMPVAVIKILGIKMGKVNGRGYCALRCPFHKNGNELNPSLYMHNVLGNYRCHACGAKGGDILSFYRQFTGKRFVEAAKDLGAWEVSHG